jgi:hypothetical protein
MGRPRKKAQDLTNDEALRKLFPKKVADKAKEEAEKNRRKPS